MTCFGRCGCRSENIEAYHICLYNFIDFCIILLIIIVFRAILSSMRFWRWIMIKEKKPFRLGTAACVASIFAMSLFWRGRTNFDVFFMYRHGADLLAGNWDRSVDFLSAAEGLPFMHQKWAMCILVNRVIDWFGMAGINWGGTAFFLVTGLLGFFIAEDLWPGKRHRKLLAAAVLMAAMCNNFVFSFRPHVVAGWGLMLELWALERYAQGRLTPGWMWAAFSASSVVTMWFHSTMWTMCFVPLLPYLCELRCLSRVPFVSDDAGRFRKWPILAGAAFIAAAGCLNPAGPGQLSYLLLSATGLDSDLYWYVNELQPIWYAASVVKPAFMAAWILLAAVSARFAFRGGRPRDMYLWLGSVLMVCIAMRMAFQSLLFMWFAAARFFELEPVDPDDAASRGLKSWTALVLCVVLMALELASMSGLISPDETDHMLGAWEADAALRASFDETADFLIGDGGYGSKLFVLETDAGSYMNYRGLRALMDNRCELYSQPDATGGSVIGTVNGIVVDGEWDGRPFDADGLDEFLRLYGIEYVLLGSDFDYGGHVFVTTVMGSLEKIWSNGTYDVYRAS